MNLDFDIKFFTFSKKISIGGGWVKFGIIVSTILISMIIAYWGTLNILQLVITFVGGLVGLVVLMRQINLGLFLIIIAGFFIPYSGPGGINATVLVVVLLLVLWFLDMFVVKKKISFARSRAMRPILALLIISIVSFGVGQIPWFVFANQAPIDAQLGGFAIVLFSIGSLLLVANLIQDMRWLERFVWLYILISAIYVIGRTIGYPDVDKLYQVGAIANSMFWTWLVAMALSQAIFNNTLRPRVRSLLIVIVGLTFYVAVIQNFDWKSGWVPPVIVAAVLFGLRFRKLLYLAIPVGLIFAFYATSNLIATDQYSWSTRLEAWVIVLDISRASPLLGLGFANYYWYAKLFPIRGYNIRFNSHSQYVDLIAQTGILGLIFFFWIFFEMLRLGWNLTKKLPSGFANAYTHGTIAGIAGTLFAGLLVDWILPFVYNIGFEGFRTSVLPWLFLGGLVSIEQIYRTQFGDQEDTNSL